MNLTSAGSTQRVPRQPVLHSEILSKKKRKVTREISIHPICRTFMKKRLFIVSNSFVYSAEILCFYLLFMVMWLTVFIVLKSPNHTCITGRNCNWSWLS